MQRAEAWMKEGRARKEIVGRVCRRCEVMDEDSTEGRKGKGKDGWSLGKLESRATSKLKVRASLQAGCSAEQVDDELQFRCASAGLGYGPLLREPPKGQAPISVIQFLRRMGLPLAPPPNGSDTTDTRSRGDSLTSCHRCRLLLPLSLYRQRHNEE
jgi:hypothetical protein